MIDLREHHDKMWAELSPEMQQRVADCAKALLSEMGSVDREKVRAEAKANPGDWGVPYHFFWGMAVRNKFRETTNDDQLPSGNWDDYYIKAIEEAVNA